MQEEKEFLKKMFEMRQNFLSHLRETREPELPHFPLQIEEKSSQRLLRSFMLKGVEEVFEALTHLKNWKTHKLTEVRTFDKEAFLEEYVDAMNFFLSGLVLLGITPEEFFKAYVKKDKIIHERLTNGY